MSNFQCSNYKNGEIIGNLCDALCHAEETTVLSCHSFYMEKEAVFSGIWNNETVVFKSIRKNTDLTTKNLFLNSTVVNSEDNFINIIKTIIKLKFNLIVNDIDAKRMSYIQYSQPGGNRYVEMKNVWTLLNDNEYLALSLYEQFDIFPKLLGTCGSLYAVEKLNSISGYWHLITLYDSQKDWEKRIKISIMILDFLHHLEKKLPEPLLICDVKMNNFGVTDDFKKVKFLDLDSVHPVSVASRITADGSDCKLHTDCDLFNCRSFCNLETHKCQHGVVNNNLQIVCERIFLGWMMGRKVMVPGLLVGSHTPPVLIEILEECANPMREEGIPRAKATKDIRNRLYNLLVHLIIS